MPADTQRRTLSEQSTRPDIQICTTRRSINYNQQQPALTRIDEREPTVRVESRGTGRDQTAQKEHDRCA